VSIVYERIAANYRIVADFVDESVRQVIRKIVPDYIESGIIGIRPHSHVIIIMDIVVFEGRIISGPEFAAARAAAACVLALAGAARGQLYREIALGFPVARVVSGGSTAPLCADRSPGSPRLLFNRFSW
jgi:hypothetical protein